jgi:hypothetical protein
VTATFRRAIDSDAVARSDPRLRALPGWERGNEVLFPGGIDRRFIQGAYWTRPEEAGEEWIPNPHFAPGDGGIGGSGSPRPANRAFCCKFNLYIIWNRLRKI